MVAKHIREAYEQGLADRERGIFDEAINDAIDTVFPYYTEEQEAAYWKGRNGEQLDADKEDDDEDEDEDDDY